MSNGKATHDLLTSAESPHLVSILLDHRVDDEFIKNLNAIPIVESVLRHEQYYVSIRLKRSQLDSADDLPDHITAAVDRLITRREAPPQPYSRMYIITEDVDKRTFTLDLQYTPDEQLKNDLRADPGINENNIRGLGKSLTVLYHPAFKHDEVRDRVERLVDAFMVRVFAAARA